MCIFERIQIKLPPDQVAVCNACAFVSQKAYIFPLWMHGISHFEDRTLCNDTAQEYEGVKATPRANLLHVVHKRTYCACSAVPCTCAYVKVKDD